MFSGFSFSKFLIPKFALTSAECGLLEIVETILVYKFPRMSHKEIEAMFSLSDLKQTKVYQEGREEGREEGSLEAKLESIPRLLALNLTVEQIAQALNLTVETVKQITQEIPSQNDEKQKK
ncbi:Rpn family recombination-promoting nuclease/putative transposase [Anabaena cylindrica FACHB-243]|nr:Rpn family recombination-promoting nuclease/putative transposase [Anabaena cylindrica FACHB-243]